MSASVGVRRTARRRSLISLSAMGLIVSVLGSTGLFAALSDSARTGSNHVDSAALPGAADLRISPAHFEGPPVAGAGGIVVCDEPFAEDLTTGGFNFSNVNPGAVMDETLYCIRNVGSQVVSLTATVDSLSDVDLLCTGDEELYNDQTCGNQLAGELAPVLQVQYDTPFCMDTTMPHAADVIGMADNVDQSVFLPSFAALPPNSTLCVRIQVQYPTTTPVDEVQRAQSDSVTWRFKFTGSAT